ncbi:hypothetical protein GIB67_030310 [Kingdonia uniflora]|uniref:Uncharacterized protein n=1 Tax=Kingdonia uniflora TaxID=39325 RepID=A0A7J7M6K2_9MAGN|nr:hypothetical protein GIB67_030310 [Kingdonia uniflora]
MLIYQYLQKSASVPYEDGDVKEEQDVNVFNDEQQQPFSDIPQLELPLLRDDGSSSPKSRTMSELKDIHVKTTATNVKSIKRKQFTKQQSEDKSLEDEPDSPRSPTIPTLEGILTKKMLENDTTTVASEREPTNENPILQKYVNRELFSVTEKSGTTVFDNMEDAKDINDDTSNDRSNNNVEMDDKEENISEEEDKLNIIFIVIQYFMIFR